MSAWLFDLGNTRLKCAPLRDDGTVGAVIALPHREDDIADAFLRDLGIARVDMLESLLEAFPLAQRLPLPTCIPTCCRVTKPP